MYRNLGAVIISFDLTRVGVYTSILQVLQFVF